MIKFNFIFLIGTVMNIEVGSMASVVENSVYIHDANEKIRVACVGDSITFGAYIIDPNDSYPHQLGTKLGHRYDVRNFGSNGATMLKQGDFPYWKLACFADALAFKPHIVIIALGTNDTKSQNWKHKSDFINDYNDMIDTFLRQNATVFVCFPPPAYAEVYGITDAIIKNEMMPIIKQVATDKSVSIIDLHTALSNKESLFPDKIHPNSQGAMAMVTEVYKNISDINIQMAKFSVTPVDWFGYDKYEFSAEDLSYCIVVPKKAAIGNPWIWRAEFFGHEPQADLALLEKGWHVVYVPSAACLYGSPEAVNRWDKAYSYLTSKYGLSAKPTLEGFSRGGLLVYNWASVNPDKVSSIYADAPVCAIQSWPGGLGKGQKKSAEDWKLCLQAYGLTEEQAADYKLNPIDKLKPLADANVPLLHVCGDADDIVPMEENTLVLKQKYESLGGHMQLITKKNCGHHPHSLVDPKPIVEFILKFNR